MSIEPLLLAPQPKHIARGEGTLSLPDTVTILLNAPLAQALQFSARQLQESLAAQGVSASLAAALDPTVVGERFLVRLNLVPASTNHAEGYALHMESSAIDLIAATPAGIFYAVQTLRQLLTAYGRELPMLRLHDAPDFPNRGVMLDISRDRVPTMETLYALVDRLSAVKYNQLQLYTEHTFAYSAHKAVWKNASPMTPDEIIALDAYCRERFVELVPNQNAFGHMRRWLVLPEYAHLAEAPDGCMTRWGWFDQPFSLNPGDPESLELVTGFFDELLPHFSSRVINVGLDETVDLGEGRSKEAVAERGIGPVFLDFLLKIYHEIKRRGHTMQFWGDIIMEHPELVELLPRDAIALEWGYEGNTPFDKHGARYAAAGIPFYVCPGTSTWNSVAGRTENALENMRNAARNGTKHGAIGYLVTDWGDNGHWQPYAASLIPFLFGAGCAWNHAAVDDAPLNQLADVHLFADGAGVLGDAALELGKVDLLTGEYIPNNALLFVTMQMDAARFRERVNDAGKAQAMSRGLALARERALYLRGLLQNAEPKSLDGEAIVAELTWAAEMLRHGAERGLLWLGDEERTPEDLETDARHLIETHDALWHARSRPGGFPESVALMEKMRASYLEPSA